MFNKSLNIEMNGNTQSTKLLYLTPRLTIHPDSLMKAFIGVFKLLQSIGMKNALIKRTDNITYLSEKLKNHMH